MWQQDGEPPVTYWSFHKPNAVLGVDPSDGPLLCVSFNAAYRKLLCGALLQLLERFVWDQSDKAAADLQEWRCYKLLTMFATAGMCPVQEDGLQTVTIVAFDATATVDIVFSNTYTDVPKVDVSCNNGDLIASWGSVTLTQFTVRLTAATPVTEDTSGTISWSTNA